MPSTYTPNSGIELIGAGEQSGTWGTTTNTNLSIIDRLTNGVGAITLVGTTHSLSTSDGSLSDGQYRVLVFGGSPTGANTVSILPNDSQHLYFVKNTTAESVILTQGSGTSATVPAGKSAIVYADGGGASANVVDLTSTFNLQPLAATLTAIAGLAVTDGNFIVGNGTTWVAESGDTALNSLGVTATATELNVLDGITATTAELNYNDVTTLGTSEASKVVTADANGDVYISEELKAKSYNETFDSVTSSSNAATVNCETGNSFSHTLTENTTFTFSNPPASGTTFTFSLKVVQDASASGFTITWPAAVDWPNTIPPTLSATANAVDVFVFMTSDGGTTWYGFTAGKTLG